VGALNADCHSPMIRNYALGQGRSQDFSNGGAEVMEAKAMKRKNCL